MSEFKIGNRKVGLNHLPFVIAEIGINHEGDLNKAIQMVEDAHKAGAECVKFQCHIIEDEMIPNDVVPGNATESIWEIMKRCSLSERQDRELKSIVENKGMIYLSTPFSRAAAFRLQSMGVKAFKIGSGECNNYPLIKLIASFGKPVILSTGMNDMESIIPAVKILSEAGVPYAILHCTSLYPTPYEKVRLGALSELKKQFPNAVLGLSDHSVGPYTCFGAIPLGARILEKHFTSSKNWPGPDISISIDPGELKELINGSQAIFRSLGGEKTILIDEKPTINFAYSSVVTIRPIKKGEKFNEENVWVKRPGTGPIQAKSFSDVLGKESIKNLDVDVQLSWDDIKS